MSGPGLTVHPEHVSFCFLATALVAPPPPETGWGVGFDGPAAQRQLALFLLEELQDSSSPILTTLPRLLQHLQQQLGTAGTALASVLVACLTGIQTPDDLVSLAERLSSFLAPPGATPVKAADVNAIVHIATSSPLGLFLRRVRLGLTSMSLQGLASLAAAVQQQVQDAVHEQQQQQQQPGSAFNSTYEGAVALKDPAVLDAYLNTLLAAVTSMGPCLPAAVIEAAAAPLQELQDSTPKLQYLKLALSTAHKDMTAALAALHQYFDSSGSSSGSMPGSSFGGFNISAAATSSSGKGKGQHQAALHNLAALQASLGHPQEALSALQELLRLGQQQGDEWSLLHGLASLCRVMSVSEGLQAGRAAAAAAPDDSGSSSAAGWGLLDLRRTEQQLQLQALLQRCLDTARDMRVPHIAAYAAVALCRFHLTHASSDSSSADGPASALPGLGSATNATGSPAAAGTSVCVQRMLLDVATLEHQAAIAAAAPGAPATALAAAAAGLVQGQPPGPGLTARSSQLYNPTDAFGQGTSTAVPGAMSAAAAAAGGSKGPAAGAGWRSSAAAVSQALAAGSVVAAAAQRLQGAPVLAGVRCLMVLTGPGGGGVHDSRIAAVIPAAAAAAAGAGAAATAAGGGTEGQAECSNSAAAAAAAAAASAGGVSAAALTGSHVHCDDVAAGWVVVIQLVLELQGVAAAQQVVAMAEAHFPRPLPHALSVAAEAVRAKAALAAGDLRGARLACEELQGLAPASPQLGLELQLVAAEAHVELLQASGCFDEAHAAAAAMFATAAGAGMQPQAVSALLLMAQACLAAGDAAGALPAALSALMHCQLLQLDSLLPEAVLRVAAAWHALAPDSAAFVLQLLQQALPMAHAQGRLKVRGELEVALAKLQLVMADVDKGTAAASRVQGREQGPTAGATAVGGRASQQVAIAGWQRTRQRLAAAADMLQQGGEIKSAAGCWLLLAHICNAAGLEQNRNEAASKWQLCQQRLPDAQLA